MDGWSSFRGEEGKSALYVLSSKVISNEREEFSGVSGHMEHQDRPCVLCLEPY
jgi:hypothetical protein